MNPNPPQPSREDIEVRITALLLGELPPAEAELLRWTIAQDAELAKVQERLQRTLGLVREVVANPDEAIAKTSAPLRLSEERRQKLLAHFKTVKPPEFVPAPFKVRRPFAWLVPLAAVLVVSAVLAALLLPALSAAKRKAQTVNSLGGNYAVLDQIETLSIPSRQPVPAASAPAAPVAAPVAMPPPAPVNIVLPTAYNEPSVSGVVQTDGVGGNGGVYSQSIVGYADASKLGVNKQTPVATFDTLSAGGNRSGNPMGGGFGGGNGFGGGFGGGGFGGSPTRNAVNSSVNLAWGGPAPSLLTATPEPNLGEPVVGEAVQSGEFSFATNLVTANFDTSGSLKDSLAVNNTAVPALQGQQQFYRDYNGIPPQAELPPGQSGMGGGGGGSTIQNGVRLPDLSLAANNASSSYAPLDANRAQLADNQYKKLDKTGGGNDVMHRLMRLREQEGEKNPSPALHPDNLPAGSSFQSRPARKAIIALPESITVATAAPAPASIPPGAASPLGQFPSAAPATPERRIYGNPTSHTTSALQSRESMSDNEPTTIAVQPSAVVPVLSDIPVTGNLFASADRQLQQKLSDGEDLPTPTLSQQMTQTYDQQMIDGERTYRSLETQLAELKSLDRKKLQEVLLKVTSDQTLNNLLAKLNAAEQSLATATNDYGPADGRITREISTVNQLQGEINAREDGIMRALESEVVSQKAAVDALQDAVVQTRIASQYQPEIAAKDNAFSTFSLNVSDVSFKLAAASLEHGVLPPAESIRSEEFINAFDYRDPEPPAGAPIGFAWERAGDAFAHNRDFLRFAIKTAAQGRAAGRPLNLVLLLDKSGSMERADRVAIIREALRVLATQLQPHDTLSVVTFARTARLYVDGVPGSQAGAVFGRLSRITPEGGTNLEEAMKLAYQTALRHFQSGGVNRVVLMTDGAANLGSVDARQFQNRVETNRKQGIALDCFGIGWEDYNDNLLELLSSHGDGRYGFLNTPEEAATGFATQLAGALQVAAADVKVQVEFNPDRVTAYRQIGYATHQLTKQQFRDNTVDAAVLGAAESGNALYVIQINPQGEGPMATVRVRSRVPGTTTVSEHSWLVPYTGTAVALNQASPAMRLAATAATFAEWLEGSPYAADVTPDQLLQYLSGVPAVYGTDPLPQKLEWMILQAKSAASNGSSGASPSIRGGF